MGKKKIPIDAFEYYFSLGCGRSYRAVARKYNVSKTAVSKIAERENWQGRIEDREMKAREAADKKAVETLEQINDRHIKVCKLIQRKAIEALQAMPLTTAMEAVRALDLAIKQERLIRGEPTDRSAVAVEDIIKTEYDRWLMVSPADGEGEQEIDEGEVDDDGDCEAA